MTFSDAHIHFFPELPALKRCSGVFLLNAVDETDWPTIYTLAGRKNFRVFLGIHPWKVADVQNGWDARLAELLQRFPMAGIGEIGFDGWKKELQSPELQARQLALFRRQLELAAEFCRPVSIHAVRAWEKIWPILREFESCPFPILFHAFAGSPELVKQLRAILGERAFFSIAAFRFRAASQPFDRLVQAIPTHRLLLETDAESLNEALQIEELYRKMSEKLAIPLSDLTAQINQNLRELANFI